jgi:Cu/Ag efflux protein CusF
MRKLCSLLLLCVGSFVGASCQQQPAKHYPVQAEVIAVDAPKNLITVKHGDIPGLMPAMTMQYMVADPKQIENLQPGDKITADLVVSDNKGELEKIALVGKPDIAPKTPEPKSPGLKH